MSSKSFRGSKNRSSSTAFISLHFNKADEEQLEISYGGKSNSGNQECAEKETNESAIGNKIESLSSEDLNKIKLDGESSKHSADDLECTKEKRDSRESTPNRDSVVKEYWSRISKRAGSLDSDMSLVDKSHDSNESWMFFKDIKGKFAKTLEERKSKETGARNLVSGKNLIKEKGIDEFDSDLTPTDTDSKVNSESYMKLSPAVEAAEIVNENTIFESFVNDELEKAKCEIFSTKAETMNSQSSLLKPKQATRKTDCNMSLSSLISNSNPIATVDPDIKQNPSGNVCTNNQETEDVKKYKSQLLIFKIFPIIEKYYNVLKASWSNFLFRVVGILIALIVAPIPSWLSGFIIGSILSGVIVYWLFKPGKPKVAFHLPNYSQLPERHIHVSEGEEEPIIYKGWMNELPSEMSYNPDTYHVNCTRSLYIRLDGSYLRASYPQNNIPKRAMFNEPRHEMQFISQQHFDVTGSSVELLPIGLARKRLWSKKYPICLRIPNPKEAVLSSLAKDTTDENLSAKGSIRKESPIKRNIPRINENNEVVLYLFSRTDRDKDLWYYRFKKASKIKMLKSHSPSSSLNIAAIDNTSLENKRTISVDLASLQLCSTTNDDDDDIFNKDIDDIDSFVDVSMSKQQKFELYMSHLLAPMLLDHTFSSISKEKKDSNGKVSKHGSVAQNNLTWLNVLIGRVFYDFLTEDMWAQAVADRIQKKLSKIKLPVFLTELIVKDIKLGTALPKIHRTSEPFTDQKGLWIDIDLSYNGSFQMTLETKLNLLRYRSAEADLSLSDVIKETENSEALRSSVYNSEEEDSAESSSDEEIPVPEVEGATEESSSQSVGGSTGKKILRFVDRLAQSTYFQHAAKNKYIKRAMEDISNTPLVLTVEVQWLTGTLALNIPPMPTDRLWYGFRTNPYLSIVARPKLGERVVTFTHVTDWIEKKLVSEFQKILVMPNMDDLIIPIMQSDSDLPKA